MSQMFERDEAGFTEAYDPNAEPGEIPVDDEAAPSASADTAQV
jgi:large subunit ribosomal protein L9